MNETKEQKRQHLMNLKKDAQNNWDKFQKTVPDSSIYKGMESRAVIAINEALNNPEHIYWNCI